MDFRTLYSNKASCPDLSVNILVSALILKEFKGISYDELMENVMFDLRFKTVLGLASIGEVQFSRATFFNFESTPKSIYITNPLKMSPLRKVFFCHEVTKTQRIKCKNKPFMICYFSNSFFYLIFWSSLNFWRFVKLFTHSK